MDDRVPCPACRFSKTTVFANGTILEKQCDTCDSTGRATPEDAAAYTLAQMGEPPVIRLLGDPFETSFWVWKARNG